MELQSLEPKSRQIKQRGSTMNIQTKTEKPLLSRNGQLTLNINSNQLDQQFTMEALLTPQRNQINQAKRLSEHNFDIKSTGNQAFNFRSSVKSQVELDKINSQSLGGPNSAVKYAQGATQGNDSIIQQENSNTNNKNGNKQRQEQFQKIRNPSYASIQQSQESVFYQVSRGQNYFNSPIQTKADDDNNMVDLKTIQEQIFEDNKNNDLILLDSQTSKDNLQDDEVSISIIKADHTQSQLFTGRNNQHKSNINNSQFILNEQLNKLDDIKLNLGDINDPKKNIQKLDTQRLFQDHQPNRFNYHNRIYTHKSINEKINKIPQFQNLKLGNNLMVNNLSKLGNNNVIFKQELSSPNIRQQHLNQIQTQSMIQAIIGNNDFPHNFNNISTGLQQHSKFNMMTSQPHITPRSLLNLSIDSDNTLDDEGHNFTIPHSMPGTGRIMSLNAQSQNQVNSKIAPIFTTTEGAENISNYKNNTSTQKIQQTHQVPLKKESEISDLWGEKNISFPDHQSYSQSTLSNMIYNRIKAAPPFSTITLPDRHIILPCIVMKHPISILGTPGTILEIVNGNVICDFREFLRENPQFSSAQLKSSISEVSLIFKIDLVKIMDRLKEYQAKLEFFYDKLSYSEICLQYFKVDHARKTVILPLVLIENLSTLEVRDCYLRSMKKEPFAQKESDDSNGRDESQGVSVFIQPTRDYLMEEIGFWINGSKMSEAKTVKEEDSEDNQDTISIAIIKSCIFYNFYDQCRIGVNGSLQLEKCHLSEARNQAVHCVNPKSIKICNCTISKPLKNGILIEWLSESSSTDQIRKINIENNEIYGTGYDQAAINIRSYFQFSAHNAIFKISDNRIYKCKGEGLRIQDLAINNIEITENDISQMSKNNVTIIQLHQKSNKFKFVMRSNRFKHSDEGYGLYICDSGFLIENCSICENKEGGMLLECKEKPCNPLQHDVSQFLQKFPMTTAIKDTEFSLNKKNGLFIKDYWKGSVQLIKCQFYQNEECGIALNAKDYPLFLSRGQPPRKLNTQKSNKSQVVPITKSIVPALDLLFLDDKTEVGGVYISDCDIQENHSHGVLMTNVQLKIYNTLILNNYSNFAVYMLHEEQKVLIKLDYYKNEYDRYINGIVGGTWGTVKLKRNGPCAGCSDPFKKQREASSRNQRPSSTKKCGLF